MEQDSNPKYTDGNFLSGCEFDVRFDSRFTESLHISKCKFQRDFNVENKYSFEIAGIDYNSWKNDLYQMLILQGEDYYNGMPLDLKEEPWNEYDENAIAVYLLGSKLGYVPRYSTGEVSDIMLFSKDYSASFNHLCFGYEMCEIMYMREFHDTSYMPYQANLHLISSIINEDFDKYAEFIKASVGHTVSFDHSFLINDDNSYIYNEFGDCVGYQVTDEEEAFLKDYISIQTDMHSTIGFINNSFIKRQCKKTKLAGFIEDVKIEKRNEQIEIKLRLFMEKSVVNKNYIKSYEALEQYFGSFNDAGSYSMPFADLIKVVPRKTRSLSAYEPLLKYLKEYHAIQLTIV